MTSQRRRRHAAFTHFYETHHRDLLDYVRRRYGALPAEEIVDDAFCALWQQHRDPRRLGMADPRHAADRVAAAYLHRHGTEIPCEPENLPLPLNRTDSDPAQCALRRLELAEVGHVLETLSDDQRRVVHHRIEFGMRYTEVAREIGKNESNVRKLAERARDHLRANLRERGWSLIPATFGGLAAWRGWSYHRHALVAVKGGAWTAAASACVVTYLLTSPPDAQTIPERSLAPVTAESTAHSLPVSPVRPPTWHPPHSASPDGSAAPSPTPPSSSSHSVDVPAYGAVHLSPTLGGGSQEEHGFTVDTPLAPVTVEGHRTGTGPSTLTVLCTEACPAAPTQSATLPRNGG